MVEGWSFCSGAACSVKLTNVLILQDNATHYPVLSRIALDYLPIQGSSVPCECIFSDVGLTDTKRRSLGWGKFAILTKFLSQIRFLFFWVLGCQSVIICIVFCCF